MKSKKENNVQVLEGLVSCNGPILSHLLKERESGKNPAHTKANDPEDGAELKPVPMATSSDESCRIMPRGMPKSGRFWKTEKKKFSTMVAVKTLHTSWNYKMAARQKLQATKLLEKELKEKKAQEIKERKEKRAAKIKRKLENERKSEVVHVIRNSAKLKRMKKKQLRKIEKR